MNDDQKLIDQFNADETLLAVAVMTRAFQRWDASGKGYAKAVSAARKFLSVHLKRKVSKDEAEQFARWVDA